MRKFCCLLLLLQLPRCTIGAAEKTGSIEPQRPALLGVVPAPAPRGVVIHKILGDSAAQKAGLKTGDLILSVNGRAITAPQTLIAEIRKYASGTVINLEYERAGIKQLVKIPLGIRLDPTFLIGKAAPAIALPLYNQQGEFVLTKGNVTIIDFWATWCGPCEPVRRALENFRRQSKNSQVSIVGITAEDTSTIRNFYAGESPIYPIAIDASNDIGVRYHIQGYPSIAVIDKKGIVRFAGFASEGLDKALELARQLAQEP